MRAPKPSRKTMRRPHLVAFVSTVLLATAPMRADVPNSAQQPTPASQPAANSFQSPDVYIPFTNGLTSPRLLKEVKPSYTGEAMRARIQGVVRLECIVELDGTVGAIRVVKSLDSATGLDDEAMKAVKLWRFVPGMKDGSPVRTLVQVELSFTLEPGTMAATLSWPDAFAIKPGQVLESGSIWSVVAASGSDLTVKFAYPPGWILAKGNHPARLLLLLKNRAPDGRACSVSRPAPSTFQLSAPLSRPAFLRLESQIRQSIAANPDTEIHGIGQIQIQGRLWVWTELSRRTVDVSALQADAAADIRNAFDGMRSWEFATTEGAQRITVSCYFLKPRGTSEVEQQDQLRLVGADFAAILNRVSVRAQ
jgi:TonB family protein